jgi:hypothetical protein
MKPKHLITLLAVATSLSACATKREVPFRAGPGEPFTGKMARHDYSTYAAIPDTPTSAVYRAVLTAIPYTRENAFHGLHAGSGNRGGKPIDEMDEIFRRHDIAYAEARSLRTLQLADAACVEALQRLDTSKMSPEARGFHARSIKFFSSRNLSLVGKPVSSYLIVREDKNCPFQTEGDVRELFKLPPLEKAVTAPVRETKPQTALASASRPHKKPLLARSGDEAKSRPKQPDTVPASPPQPLLARQP